MRRILTQRYYILKRQQTKASQEQRARFIRKQLPNHLEYRRSRSQHQNHCSASYPRLYTFISITRSHCGEDNSPNIDFVEIFDIYRGRQGAAIEDLENTVSTSKSTIYTRTLVSFHP
jgi:hypothetical protein